MILAEKIPPKETNPGGKNTALMKDLKKQVLDFEKIVAAKLFKSDVFFFASIGYDIERGCFLEGGGEGVEAAAAVVAAVAGKKEVSCLTRTKYNH